jgi:hypothetical protein
MKQFLILVNLFFATPQYFAVPCFNFNYLISLSFSRGGEL